MKTSTILYIVVILGISIYLCVWLKQTADKSIRNPWTTPQAQAPQAKVVLTENKGVIQAGQGYADLFVLYMDDKSVKWDIRMKKQ